MKKYYKINTVNKLAKPISEAKALRETMSREFIPWYENDEIVFIADLSEDYETVKKIVCNKLDEIHVTFDEECFYHEESFDEVFYI